MQTETDRQRHGVHYIYVYVNKTKKAIQLTQNKCDRTNEKRPLGAL